MRRTEFTLKYAVLALRRWRYQLNKQSAFPRSNRGYWFGWRSSANGSNEDDFFSHKHINLEVRAGLAGRDRNRWWGQSVLNRIQYKFILVSLVVRPKLKRIRTKRMNCNDADCMLAFARLQPQLVGFHPTPPPIQIVSLNPRTIWIPRVHHITFNEPAPQKGNKREPGHVQNST